MHLIREPEGAAEEVLAKASKRVWIEFLFSWVIAWEGVLLVENL